MKQEELQVGGTVSEKGGRPTMPCGTTHTTLDCVGWVGWAFARRHFSWPASRHRQHRLGHHGVDQAVLHLGWVEGNAAGG